MPNQPDLCSRAVGDENWAGSSNAEYEHLPALLAHFLTAKSLDDVPRELIDLRQDHAKISTPWAFDVEEICINGHIFYVLSPSADPQAQPKVVLQNAATVLQIARVGWSDAREIARNLVARGMEFWLWDEIPAPPPERPLQPPSSAAYNGLGLRPLDFKPTRADYEDYVERRNAFLRSPRGRAARFAGGIVGRLAREVDIDDGSPDS
ncbi:hypothetical protein C8R47DRAFT_399406 [Mycena vitilis]|nr:hypothetical protein C8R47DRAFT_399406 [Mycena vitilis]